ncbi:MAG TPA: hypothetical protein VIL41_05090 [Coriobacteriia bacterium]
MCPASDGHAPTKQPRPARKPRTDLKAYAESRGSAFLAAGIIIAGQAWLASSLALRPVWLFPALSAALLIASVAVYRSDLEEPSLPMRWFARGVVGMLAVGNTAFLMVLVRGVFTTSKLDPFGLLLAGVVLWVVNIAVFALAYWEIDGGGPEDRAKDSAKLPDLVFPQQQADQEGLAPEGWTPTFSDYLYVSVTAATAFSPTDAMPYSGTAKLLMGLESTISFGVIVMLVARAVNVAKG